MSFAPDAGCWLAMVAREREEEDGERERVGSARGEETTAAGVKPARASDRGRDCASRVDRVWINGLGDFWRRAVRAKASIR